MSDTAERYAKLPKHLAAASALFHDPDERVLLVKPTYRDGWLLPGGGLEPGEYPWEATRREIEEELGLQLDGEPRLLAVDWTGPRPGGRPSLVVFVFDGGVMTTDEAKQRISLPPDELSEWRFVAAVDWQQHVSACIARRLGACTQALKQHSAVYLQDGWML